MDKIKFKIVTPEKIAYDGEGDSISIPTNEGEITVLPNHIPIISILDAGEVVVRNGGNEESLAVTGGFIEIGENEIVLLADASDRAEDLSEEKIEEAIKQAKETMEKAPEEEIRTNASEDLEKALVKLKIVRKIARRRGKAD